MVMSYAIFQRWPNLMLFLAMTKSQAHFGEKILGVGNVRDSTNRSECRSKPPYNFHDLYYSYSVLSSILDSRQVSDTFWWKNPTCRKRWEAPPTKILETRHVSDKFWWNNPKCPKKVGASPDKNFGIEKNFRCGDTPTPPSPEKL